MPASLLRTGSLLAILIPAFFVMEHVGPDGLAEAQGCSGGSPGVAGPSAVIRRLNGLAPSVEVATDGFFLIDVSSVTTTLSALQVDVVTADGTKVPGTQQELRTSTGQPLYGWSADAPLALGTKLNAKLSVAPAGLQDEAALEVVAAPAELDAGVASLEAWVDYGHGVGPAVVCQRPPGGCLSQPIVSVYAAELLLHGARYTWRTTQPIRGFIAWEVSVERETLPPAEESLVTPPAELFLGFPPAALSVGPLAFASNTREYCAKVTVRDLRDGEQVTSRLCGEPGVATETYRDYFLELCDSPPSEALTEAWCQLHRGTTVEACRRPDSVDQPGEAPMPSDPNAPTGSDADARRPRTSSGCQLSPGTSRHASFAAFVAAVALGGLVRRRRARS